MASSKHKKLDQLDVAERPFTYEALDAVMKVKGFVAVKSHDINSDKFMYWVKYDDEGNIEKAFTVGKPRHRARGYDEPVWPEKDMMTYFRLQGVVEYSPSLEMELKINNDK